MSFNINGDCYICQKCVSKIYQFKGNKMAVQAIENKITSFDCKCGECEIFKCFECTFTKLMNLNIFCKKINLSRFEIFESKNGRFSSLDMGVISDMLQDGNINLKEASFKFIRSTFAPNFKYIHDTIKADILSTKSNLEMSFFTYFVLMFGFRPGFFMNQDDVGFLHIKKKNIKFENNNIDLNFFCKSAGKIECKFDLNNDLIEKFSLIFFNSNTLLFENIYKINEACFLVYSNSILPGL